MKSKLYLLSALILILAVGVVSAVITLTITTPPTTLTEIQNSTSFKISSTGGVLVNFTYLPTAKIIDSDSHTANLRIINTSILENVTLATFDVIITNIDSDFNFGEHSTTLIIGAVNATNSSDNTSISVPISFEVPFCDCANPGELEIDIDDVYVKEGFGDDDEYWYPFDEIEIDLFIESDTYDIEDIEIEWELYTESGDKIADDTENDFNLDEGEDKEIMISFKLDKKLNKLEGEDKLIFYVKAEGRIDDKDYGEDEDTCDWAYEEVELITDDDFVVLDDIQFPELVQCGAEVQITADVWNIGDDDQDDVYVTIYNHELGINEQIEIGDLDAFDDIKLDALIKLPTNAEEKWYSLIFWVYDEDNEIYENSEDELAKFIVPFKIEGNCISGPTVLVTANLESGGNAGQELVVKATITNIGNKLSTYDLNVIGYDGWASSVELDKNKVILGEGESKDVLLTFDVKEGVAGDELFDLQLLSGGEVVLTKAISVPIESAGFSFPGITGSVISKDNWYLWGIGALNVILVIIIIFVAIKAIKK